MPLVLLDSHGPVRVLTLAAPERRNALDWPLLAELAAAVRTVAADEAARALVVTGAGKAFCAGADLANLFGDLDRPTDEMREHLMGVYDSFLGIRDLSIPTIAAVNGAAIGAGMNIALVCDVVVAGPYAGFGPTFAEIGLHPGGGCSWMLTERIGRGRATAALLAGAVIGADEAGRIGLADVVADDAVAEATRLAGLYAGRDARLMADIKQSVRLAATSDLPTSVAFEADAQARSMRNEQFRAFAQRFAD